MTNEGYQPEENLDRNNPPGNEQQPKRMDLNEFRDGGFLQEVNRQFFHPLGLALEIFTDEEGNVAEIGGIWDYRDDEEGLLFDIANRSEEEQQEFKEKYLNVLKEMKKHASVRVQMFGQNYGVQEPIPGIEPPYFGIDKV